MAHFQPTPQEKSRPCGADGQEAFDSDDNGADDPFCILIVVCLGVFKFGLIVN